MFYLLINSSFGTSQKEPENDPHRGDHTYGDYFIQACIKPLNTSISAMQKMHIAHLFHNIVLYKMVVELTQTDSTLVRDWKNKRIDSIR